MKKFIPFILLILFLFLTNFCYASIRNIQDNYQQIYHILDQNGDPVSGQTVALKIKKVSNGHWYDFNDDTFKASGWTSKSTNLSEDATEDYYYYTFNPPASETAAEQYVFLLDNADATYGDHQSAIVYYQGLGDADDSDIDTQLVAIQADLDSPNQYKATGFSTHAAADIWSVVTRALTDKAGFSLGAAGIDSIWDEAQVGHTVAGTFGKYLDSEISGVTASVSDADIDKIWDETLADHLAAGSTGKKLSEMPTPYSIYP